LEEPNYVFQYNMMHTKQACWGRTRVHTLVLYLTQIKIISICHLVLQMQQCWCYFFSPYVWVRGHCFNSHLLLKLMSMNYVALFLERHIEGT